VSLDGQAKVSAALQDVARELGMRLSEIAGERVLFSLLVFGEGADGRAQYVSNADRAGVRESLRELLAHWDANDGKDDGPYHVLRKAN
jgi:hypothetical protein